MSEKSNKQDGRLPPEADATGSGNRRAFAEHPRLWGAFDYVYPVVSRRSHGLSIGINLNPDTACNFDCIYCCVDRTQPPPRTDVDLDQVGRELRQLLGWAKDDSIWRHEPFDTVSPEYRRVNDIAFSGNGEPTSYAKFDEAVQQALGIRHELGLNDVKLIVITNATLFDRPRVRQALDRFDPKHDEVWAKLDAGTEAYFREIDRTKIPLRRVLDNLRDFGREHPLVLQSLFMEVAGTPLPDAEFEAYLDRVAALMAEGCRIKAVQLYTVARATAEAFVAPLCDAHMNRLGTRFRQRLPELPVEVFRAPR